MTETVRDGDIVSAVDPALAIIEAKRSSIVVQESSMAQLLAQIHVVNKENPAAVRIGERGYHNALDR